MHIYFNKKAQDCIVHNILISLSGIVFRIKNKVGYLSSERCFVML